MRYHSGMTFHQRLQLLSITCAAVDITTPGEKRTTLERITTNLIDDYKTLDYGVICQEMAATGVDCQVL